MRDGEASRIVNILSLMGRGQSEKNGMFENIFNSKKLQWKMGAQQKRIVHDQYGHFYNKLERFSNIRIFLSKMTNQ